jgi:hypothetical protein
VALEDAPDGDPRRWLGESVLQVVKDGLRAGVETRVGELLAELEDGGFKLGLGPEWTLTRAVVEVLDGGWTAAFVAGEQSVKPSTRDRVLTSQLVRTLTTHDHRFDQEPP